MNYKYFYLKRKNKEDFCIWIWPSVMILLAIFFLFLMVLNVLFRHIDLSFWKEIYLDKFILKIIFFTSLQSVCSAFLSVFFAIVSAHSLYHQYFPGRKILLNVFNMILVQPIIVSVLGIIDIYGNQGWLSNIFRHLHLPYKSCLYSFKGTILVQTFFNIPLAIHFFLQELENIPIEYKQLAVQINMSRFEFFQIIEWFYIKKKIFSITILIFILCFTNFSSIYSLGGSAKYPPIGLVIYQSLYYDFNINYAFILMILQMLICTLLILNCPKSFKFISENLSNNNKKNLFIENFSFSSKIINWLIILIISFFLVSPLLTTIINGFKNIKIIEIFTQKSLWKSVYISLTFSIITGILCLTSTIILIRINCELRLHQYNFLSKIIDFIEIFILSVPNYMFAIGLFPLLINLSNIEIFLIILIIKTLLSLPYSIRIIESSMHKTLKRYHKLSCSLNLRGFRRFWMIEFPAFKKEIGKILSFTSTLSMGDLGLILFFGNDKLCTLPLYLYQQMHNYQNKESSVTAMILLLFCLCLFLFFNKVFSFYDRTK